MVCVTKNQRFFEMTIDTNMKEIRNSMETYKVRLESFDTCSTIYSANLDTI
jgi:hypothetical protein